MYAPGTVYIQIGEKLPMYLINDRLYFESVSFHFGYYYIPFEYYRLHQFSPLGSRRVFCPCPTWLLCMPVYGKLTFDNCAGSIVCFLPLSISSFARHFEEENSMIVNISGKSGNFGNIRGFE